MHDSAATPDRAQQDALARIRIAPRRPALKGGRLQTLSMKCLSREVMSQSLRADGDGQREHLSEPVGM